jgi:hypothetical protein
MINALGKGSQNEPITAEAGQRAREPSTQDDRDLLWSASRIVMASWQSGLAWSFPFRQESRLWGKGCLSKSEHFLGKIAQYGSRVREGRLPTDRSAFLHRGRGLTGCGGSNQ